MKAQDIRCVQVRLCQLAVGAHRFNTVSAKEIVIHKMKSLRFFLVLLLVWLGTQIVIWGWSEFILKGSQLERMLELEYVEPYLKIPFYLLFPVPYAVTVTHRIVKKENA